MADQWVKLYYFQYAFILKISLSTLAVKASDEMFNLWLGDAVLFPEDYSWITAYSMEQQWKFGMNR